MELEELDRYNSGQKILSKIKTLESQLEIVRKMNHVQVTVTGFGEKGLLPDNKYKKHFFDIPAHNFGNGEEKHIYHDEAKSFIEGYALKLEAKIKELKDLFKSL